MKIRARGKAYPMQIDLEDGMYFCKSKVFSRSVNEILKETFNARWNPDRKLWYFPASERTDFQLQN